MAKSRRRSGASLLFMILAALLLLIALFLGMRAMNTWSDYQARAAETPVPTPTVHSIDVTRDPWLVTATPEPTQILMASGSEGEGVRELQQLLQKFGYYTGEIDGQYGSGTLEAVRLFQAQHNLQPDGIAGEKTWDMLHSSQAHPIQVTPTPAAHDTLSGSVPLLVNREHAVPEDFYPANLVTIEEFAPQGLLLYKIKGVKGVKEAVDALIQMVEDATRQGISPWQISEGYRTYQDQKDIFDNYVDQYMQEGFSRDNARSATRQTVADPGQSEHHTGLAFDLTVPGEFFSDTAQYAWLALNCWDYGFIMRYTDEKSDITGFLGEEWHVRYVGLEHSKKMQQMDMCLEEYIEYLGY